MDTGDNNPWFYFTGPVLLLLLLPLPLVDYTLTKHLSSQQKQLWRRGAGSKKHTVSSLLIVFWGEAHSSCRWSSLLGSRFLHPRRRVNPESVLLSFIVRIIYPVSGSLSHAYCQSPLLSCAQWSGEDVRRLTQGSPDLWSRKWNCKRGIKMPFVE